MALRLVLRRVEEPRRPWICEWSFVMFCGNLLKYRSCSRDNR